MSNYSNVSGIEKSADSYSEFWNWFITKESYFFNIIQDRERIEEEFLNLVHPKLGDVKDGLYLLAGMLDDNTAEFVITAEGDLKNIAFAEEIVASAPNLRGWKFTALKPEAKESFTMKMGDVTISEDSLYFYEKRSWEQPDLIEITFVHNDLKEENSEMVTRGIYNFLESYLGEIGLAGDIDELNIIGKHEAEKEVLHLSELKPYLAERKAAFIEKYDEIRVNTKNDLHSIIEAEFESGLPYIAVINSELLKWDSKPSYPWLARIDLEFGGNDVGLADEAAYQFLENVENDINDELKDVDGYLNVARDTAKGIRSVYFACKDFRKPSKVFYYIKNKYSDKLGIQYLIYKDKYWLSLDQFINEDDGGLEN